MVRSEVTLRIFKWTKKPNKILVLAEKHIRPQEILITSPPPYTLIICECAVPRFLTDLGLSKSSN